MVMLKVQWLYLPSSNSARLLSQATADESCWEGLSCLLLLINQQTNTTQLQQAYTDRYNSLVDSVAEDNNYTRYVKWSGKRSDDEMFLGSS